MRGFQVFLLQSLSSSLGTFETISSLLYVDQPVLRSLFSPGNCDITPIVRIVLHRMEGAACMRMIATIS